MAIAGFQMRDIVRSKKQNIIATAAYIGRQNIYDHTEEKMKYHHANTKDLIEFKMYLPDGAPAKYENPAELWNDIQAMKYDNQGKAMILSLPAEASHEQHIEMVELFVRRNLLSQNLLVEVAFHNEKIKKRKYGSGEPKQEEHNKNFHVHVLCTGLSIINGKWSEVKSRSPYVDEDGNILEKIDSPRLKNKKLQYDKNENIIMKKDWKQLQYNDDGTPMLNNDGTPVLVDIRVPVLDRDGKQKVSVDKKGYKTPLWKTKKIWECPINKFGTIKDYRMSWGECQNEILRRYKVLDENGEILQIDMRSYAEQDAGLPPELQRKPQLKIFDKENEDNKEILEYNEKINMRNKKVMDIRKLIEENAKLETEIADEEKLAAEEKVIISRINPKAEWVNTWTRHAKILSDRASSVFSKMNLKLDNTMRQSLKKLDSTPAGRRNDIEYNRIAKHYKLMEELIKTVDPNRINGDQEIEAKAEAAWKKLTDQQKVSFVRDRYGYETAKIYAKVLAREKNNLDIIDGLDQTTPFYPNEKTDSTAIQIIGKQICKTKNFASYEQAAYIKWDTAGSQSPPQEIINVLKTYSTAEKHYGNQLENKPTYIVNITPGIEYNPTEIEAEAKTANAELDKAERVEAEAKAKAKAEARAKAEAEARVKLETERKVAKAKAETKAKTEAKKQTKNQGPIIMFPQIANADKAKTQVVPAKISEQEQKRQLAQQQQLETERKRQQQAEKRRIAVTINYRSLIPQFQMAVKTKDMDTINKMSARVMETFGKAEAEQKYKSAGSARKIAAETLLNEYVNRKASLPESRRELEKEYMTANGRLNMRKLLADIKKYNETAGEYDVINVDNHRQASDEENFWYGMLNPDKTIRLTKAEKESMELSGIEIQVAPEHLSARALPAGTRRTNEIHPENASQSRSASIIENGKSGIAHFNIQLDTKDNDHDKNAMEIAEEEMYKHWNPWKKFSR